MLQRKQLPKNFDVMRQAFEGKRQQNNRLQAELNNLPENLASRFFPQSANLCRRRTMAII